MRQTHLSRTSRTSRSDFAALEDAHMAVALLAFVAALVAGLAAFHFAASAEYERCTARYSGRTTQQLQQLCGVRP